MFKKYTDLLWAMALCIWFFAFVLFLTYQEQPKESSSYEENKCRSIAAHFTGKVLYTQQGAEPECELIKH